MGAWLDTGHCEKPELDYSIQMREEVAQVVGRGRLDTSMKSR